MAMVFHDFSEDTKNKLLTDLQLIIEIILHPSGLILHTF